MSKRVLFAAAVVCSMTFAAYGREGFGSFSKKLIEATRVVPPGINVTGSTVKVSVDADRTRVASKAGTLRQYTEAAVLAGNKSMTAASPADINITIAVDRVDADQRTEQKTDYDTEKTKDSKGKTTYKSVPKTTDFTHSTGDIAGTYKITDAKGRLLDSGDFDRHWEYDYDYRPLDNEKVKDLLMKDAADKIAARVVSTQVKTKILMPKGSFEQYIPLAESGQWDKYLAAVSAVAPLRDRASDAYRQFALGIANEMVGYNTADPKAALEYLRKASEYYHAAASYNPDEKLFSEKYTGFLSASSSPVDRVDASVKAYERWASGPTAPKETAVAAAKPKSKSIHNQEVIEMSKAGLSDENIIMAIDAAETAEFDTTPAGLISLSKAGVSKSVIARMQKQK